MTTDIKLTAEHLAADFMALKSISNFNGCVLYTNKNGDTRVVRSWAAFDRVLINSIPHGKKLFTRTLSRAAWRIVKGSK